MELRLYSFRNPKASTTCLMGFGVRSNKSLAFKAHLILELL